MPYIRHHKANPDATWFGPNLPDIAQMTAQIFGKDERGGHSVYFAATLADETRAAAAHMLSGTRWETVNGCLIRIEDADLDVTGISVSDVLLGETGVVSV